MLSKTSCWLLLVTLQFAVAQNDKTPNLRFTVEPPALVNFPHSSGARVPCVASGHPTPTVSWISGNVSSVVGQRGLRSVEPDGTLEFFPFRPDQYRQDIHDAVYRCIASNSLGTIGSRDVKVKAVISGPAEVRVEDEYVSLRNTAVFRCHVPTPTGNHVTLSEWQTDDGMAFIADASTEVNYGRYQIFGPGILHISGVTPTDAMKKYGCRMKNLLTGEILKTTNFAKLVLSETPEQYPPRFVDEPMKWSYQPNEVAYLPCVAHSNPPATYRWHRVEGGRSIVVNLGSRAEVRDGTLILRRVTLSDSGTYICMANNSFGHGRIERELVVTAPLRVEISPSKMRVSPGEEVSVNCTVSGGPVHGVFWMKDQKPLSALGSRIRQLSVKSIQIRSFQHDYSGFYQCYAFNDRDSAQGVAEVCQRAEPPKFVNTFSKQLTMAGRGVSLACVANGWPTVQIRWLLDGSEIPDDGHVVFGDHVYKNNSVASYVNISSIKPQDGGLYKCTATNEMGTATHSGRIDILGPPVVRATKNITIAASETVVLTCPVSGYPIKEIVIERGSRRLPYNERHNVLDKGTIQIYGVRKEDEGMYRCVAHSGRGERAEGTLVLQVVSAPVISPFSFPSNLQEGMRISATCTVIAGDAPVAIHWTKDGNPVNHVGSEVEVLSLTDFVSSLIINKLSRRQTGNYTCSAVNSVSAVNFTARMVVHAAPQWTIVPEEKMATAGSSVLFDCQAQGEPNPVVRWKREEDTKPPMYHNILSSPQMHVLENGSLHITTVSKADQGYYLCEVTNGIGENLRSRVKLTVHNLPQVQSASHTVKGRKGEKTTLSCSASGDPPLTVTWRKDGVPIHTHGNSGRYLNQDPSNEKGATKISRLILLSAERDDSALFTCIASNPFGEDKADLRVIIQEPPDSPADLRPMDVTNSAITLTWTPPFNGNSPITSYTISYKNEIGQWRGNAGKDIRLSGEDTSVTLTDLEPITTYRFQVVAENLLGISVPSRDLEVTTRKGAPRHAPEEVTVVALNSTAIKVTWKIPGTLSERPHLIDGFYIGYREAASENNFVYSTVSVNPNKNSEEFIIAALNRYSRYTIIVQAFNSEGAGPASDELAVQTYEFDPPGQPVLKLHSVTSSTVSVTWEMPVDQNPVSGFVLRYKESNSGWNEIQISELRSSYSVEALRCGSPYNLRLTAFNNVGSGEPSNSVQVTTSGKAPVAPDKAAFIRCNSTYVTCNLRAWLDNGCVISHFVIQYKAKTEGDWVLISNHILPSEETVYLTDLLPGTWYVMLMSAHNDAGHTEKDYEFATLTASGATVPPMAMSTANSGSLFEDPTILVPIICAIVVLIVIIAVTAVVLAWKRRDAAETSEVCSGNSGGRADNISMCSYGKVKGGGGGGGGNSSIYQPQREPLYFPSPYATSHVSGQGGVPVGALTSEQQHRHHIQSGFSGSLRRHQGSRMGEHVYDIPQRPQQIFPVTSFRKPSL